MKNIDFLRFDVMGDDRGALVALEQFRQIPFDIKRVYYIFDTRHGVDRGKHAHRNLEQVLICVNGSCTIVLDDGSSVKEVKLDYPDQGLYIGKNIWREMKNFSQGCVLMVLANQYYDEHEYIRSYDEFKQSLKS
ncbi:sugar 3,4-ketoisomerase [Pseudodesulfovibrio tunisiensis]|uniref:sugar 3,4-ketoisomerase n=1 Tax=Pseudodesulfovibrio tunisiensis TaxID=463192 RepID=UPI001FB45149|nr:FdtA/QdtA family cupin domain-containing protein [Pseudodesulfovibrio tunisiensis]